ncbi:unnamed protein product [Auanema sp. JU1783]|nr:unnamed protein product [Auanema sp. JU1783]
MGITKDYLRYEHGGSCSVLGSSNGAIIAVDNTTCAVTACENVAFYNLKTSEKVFEISESTKAATCLKFSHDKRWLAVGYADGNIRLFDRQEGGESIMFSGHKKGVNSLAFSHDGLTLASGGKDCTVILWDIVSESGMFRLNGHKDSITHLQFSKNDKFLLTASKDSFLKFWCIASQSCFYTVLDSHSEIYSFALLNDDKLLIAATSELELLVFQINWMGDEKKEDEENEAPTAKKSLLDIKEDDETEDMENKYVRVALKGKLLRQCKGRALQLSLSTDNRYLFCLGSDKLVDIYRVFTEEESIKRLSKKLSAAKRKATSKDDVTTSQVKKDVTIWITRVGDYRGDTKIKWIDFTPKLTKSEGNLVGYAAYALTFDNNVEMLKFEADISSNTITGEVQYNLEKLGHREDIRSLSVTSSSNGIASGGGSELLIWNTHSLRPIATLTDESMREITCVQFVTGDKHVLAGTKTGYLHLWNIGSCELLESKKEHEGAIWSIVQLPDRTGFVTVSSDKKVKFWTYELVSEGTMKRLSIREKQTLDVNDEALCCAISPNGKFLVVGLLDNTCSVFFLDTLKFFVSLYGHSLPVTCVTICPDSKLVVTGSADKSIKIWGLDFGDCHKSFHAHDDVVSAVMFSPSEELLVWSAGKDGKVKQWDATKLQRVQVLDRHLGPVRALAQSETGSLLFSASNDKSIRCWELTEEIIVLEEEEELEREKEYEEKLLDEDDVVPGENNEAEAGLATTKNAQSIISTENILEAVDIARSEKLLIENDPTHKPHPLYESYRSKSLDHFIVDVIAKCRPSNLERCLLMVPLSYIADILKSLSFCVHKHYKIELCSRVALFLIRVHHSHVINSVEMLTVVEKLRKEMPGGIADIRDMIGLNMAALELLKLELEEAQDLKLFSDISEIEKNTKRKNKNRKAVIKTLV